LCKISDATYLMGKVVRNEIGELIDIIEAEVIFEFEREEHDKSDCDSDDDYEESTNEESSADERSDHESVDGET